ncbi:maleylpyruvate isomerase N-terminal domain-containing protein [Streptomyces sp. NPDC053560]|uniref:maleylpyruvate isomerase N-terminal domain-containing protein n=1 Tax=Streptomyces sp. NPDC053560 TaxID=3365711 RepID=UPI0037D498C3
MGGTARGRGRPARERFWQLLCVLGGRPTPPSLARAGDWLTTALRANPTPGACDTQLEALYRDVSDPWPCGALDACARVQYSVAALVRDTPPTDFDLPAPCGGWTVRGLLDHLVGENVLWGDLAQGMPPTGGHTDDHLGPDHVAAFETAANEALTAFRQPGMLTRTFGPAPPRAPPGRAARHRAARARLGPGGRARPQPRPAAGPRTSRTAGRTRDLRRPAPYRRWFLRSASAGAQ